MNSTELIEAGVDALPFVVWRELMMEDVVEYVLDAVEPLIRADERERVSIELERPAAITAHREVRADLRAQVVALHAKAEVVGLSERAFAYEVVLKLMNGSSA